jgi:hypothetical protein
MKTLDPIRRRIRIAARSVHAGRAVAGIMAVMGATLAPLAGHAQDSLTGTWNGAVLEARSNCFNAPNNGSHGTYAQYDIGIGNGAILITQSGITGLQCNYLGTYSQAGADRQASGTLTCSDGKRGTWQVTNFLVTENEMSLKLSEQLNTTEICTINAVLGGSRLSATQPPLPSIDYTGAWYNPNESGWGVSVVKGASNVLGVIIYHYDLNHSPTWFILQSGIWQNTTTFSGTLNRVTGPPYNEAFDAGMVAYAPVGNATLSFASATEATLSYTVNGVMQTKSLSRLSF